MGNTLKEQWKEDIKAHKSAEKERMWEKARPIAKKIMEDGLMPMFQRLHQNDPQEETLIVYVIANEKKYLLLTDSMKIEVHDYPAETNEDDIQYIWDEVVVREAKIHEVDDACQLPSLFSEFRLYQFSMYLK